MELAHIAFHARPRGPWLLQMKIEAALTISFDGLETYDPYEQELGACYGENVGREAS